MWKLGDKSARSLSQWMKLHLGPNLRNTFDGRPLRRNCRERHIDKEERKVIIQLINSKCLPCLLYALEACPVNKTQERSLEFTVNKVLMKVFRTISMDVLTECRLWFGISETKNCWLLSGKWSFWKKLFRPAMCCVKCSPIVRMLSLALTRRVVTDWYIDWLIYFVCCCCALAFVFFMLAANWRNKVD